MSVYTFARLGKWQGQIQYAQFEMLDELPVAINRSSPLDETAVDVLAMANWQSAVYIVFITSGLNRR